MFVSDANTVSLAADEAALWFAERAQTGFLVALWIDPETAAKLVVAGGEPADNLHITLCGCGDIAEMGDLAVYRAVAAVERVVRWWGAVEGTVSGYGRFGPSDAADPQDVFYASVDIIGLTELREQVQTALYEASVPPSTTHGFTPHITLAYLAADAANPADQVPPLPLKFGGVTVMVGTKRIDIPFVSPDSGGYVSMANATLDVPLDAPLGTVPIRPLLFSFDQEWISYLPKPGNYAYRDRQNLDFSKETYDRILTNFNNRVYKQDLPIRVEHDSIAAGAIGWIREGGMRLADDGSIEVRPEWTEMGQALIDGDRFRYVSAEVALKWQNPVDREWHTDVPVGLAICTRPHFKADVLQPLAASEGAALVMAQSLRTAGVSGTEGTMSDKDQGTTATTTTAPPVVTATGEPPPRTINDFTLTEVVISAEQRQRERDHVVQLTQRVELAEARAVTAEADLKAARRDQLSDWAKAEVLGRSADNGTAWFGSIQENTSWLLSEAETYGRESDNVKRLIRHKRQEANAIHATGIFDPISKGGQEPVGDVASQVRHLAEIKMQADPKLTYEMAETQVYNEKPELYVRILNAR